MLSEKQKRGQPFTMLSEKQKRVLFGTTIRRRPQYVRVPLQTVNGVHELKSDLQFERILPAYEVARVPEV